MISKIQNGENIEQYGFYFDCNICVGCGACQFACREANQLSQGQFFCRLLRMEKGSGLKYTGFFSAGCMHCLEPACVAACPRIGPGDRFINDLPGLTGGYLNYYN